MITFEQQTFAKAYHQLASEEEGFRVTMGDFMDEVFSNAPLSISARNSSLLPLRYPSLAQRGWAAFCTGAAVDLANHYGLPYPS